MTQRSVVLPDAADPNVTLDWDITRDAFFRMTASANTRRTDDPNDDRVAAYYGYERNLIGAPTSEIFSQYGITDANDPNYARLFHYDTLHRLTGVDYPNAPNEAFAYDLAGNRISYADRDANDTYYEPNTANPDNQYTAIDGPRSDPNYDPNYDAAGNLTRDHRGYSYVYDADNHLIQATVAGETTRSFIYDALGRRVGRVSIQMPLVRYYVYSGQNVVEEYDSSGNRRYRFIHGPTYIDERVVMTEFDPNDPNVGFDYVYLMKDLYTVAGLVDFKGWLVESYDYDAYGKVTLTRHACFPYCFDYDGDGDVDDDDRDIFDSHYNGDGNAPNGFAGWRSDGDRDGDVGGVDATLFNLADNGPNQPPSGSECLLSGALAASRVGNPYYFTGRRLDQRDFDDNDTPTVFTDDTYHLQLYHYRARAYDPVVGRFNQRDPVGYVDGMSLYEYTRSVPPLATDPLGLVSDSDCSNGVPPPFPDFPTAGEHIRTFDWLFAHYIGKSGDPVFLNSVEASGVMLNSEEVRTVLAQSLTVATEQAKRLTCESPGGSASGSHAIAITKRAGIARGDWRLSIQQFTFKGSAICVISKECCPCSTSQWKRIQATCTFDFTGWDTYNFDVWTLSWIPGTPYLIAWEWTTTVSECRERKCQENEY